MINFREIFNSSYGYLFLGIIFVLFLILIFVRYLRCPFLVDVYIISQWIFQTIFWK